jgi:transposase
VKRDEVAKKRKHAGELMEAGRSPAEVAKAVGVSRQTAYRWKATLAQGGPERLASMPYGRPPRLNADQCEALLAVLRLSAQTCGFSSPAWTLKRVSMQIARMHGVRYSETHVSRLLAALKTRL